MTPRRLTHALATLYALAIGVLIYCAHTSHENGSLLHTVLFIGLACLFGCAIAHHAYLCDELHFACVRLERASRPPKPAIDGAVAVALAGACCEMWWTSAGTEHDHQCTRKDQTA
ncbi:hypothetical protein ACFWOL_15425 [Streptomyces sp. NPDC058442]|uniref:hypothetical protein n=1 Tax=Streptomyces sp. NPDC058442 TaxID=3346503 RepID=UPI003668FFFF